MGLVKCPFPQRNYAIRGDPSIEVRLSEKKRKRYKVKNKRGSLGLIVEGQGARAVVILVLHECIWNARMTLPAPWVLLCVRWSIPLFKWFHPG